MEDKKLTEKESIELISSMISRTKERYIGDGNILLMWGYVVAAVTVLVWALLIATHNPVWNWLWFLIWIVGGTITPAMMRKKRAKYGVTSYSDKLTAQIWSVVGFSAIAFTFCCLGFMLFRGVDSWRMMWAFALIIVPFAEIAQGIVLKEASLVAGGAIGLLAGIFTGCCVAGGIVLYANWYLPLFLAAFICMMIIPGHIINIKAKRR